MPTPNSKKWDLNQIEKHIKVNTTDSYGGAIVSAALFFKIYGYFPKIGLSGFQAEAASSLLDLLPDPEPDKQLELPGIGRITT